MENQTSSFVFSYVLNAGELDCQNSGMALFTLELVGHRLFDRNVENNGCDGVGCFHDGSLFGMASYSKGKKS